MTARCQRPTSTSDLWLGQEGRAQISRIQRPVPTPMHPQLSSCSLLPVFPASSMHTWRQHGPHRKQAARVQARTHLHALPGPKPGESDDGRADAAAAPSPSQWPSRIVGSCEVHPCPEPPPGPSSFRPQPAFFEFGHFPWTGRASVLPFRILFPRRPHCQPQYDIYLLLAPWSPIDPSPPFRAQHIDCPQ